MTLEREQLRSVLHRASSTGMEDLVGESGLVDAALPEPENRQVLEQVIIPSAEELRRLLERDLRVVTSAERDAVVQAGSAAEYEHFHAAAFGDYYSRMAEPGLRADFFRAVGEAAWRRQQERGHVSHMPVRLWKTTTRG
ncbi:hypothetical protein [Streptomyces sp. NPDC006134]|uniref:hypothetical protein n=1 Tax=Streptomyces sp. NPDC006134 TaxID=3154467 RepID=UPI003411A6D9